MTISRKILASLILSTAAVLPGCSSAQIGLPTTAMTAGRDTSIQQARPEQAPAQQAPSQQAPAEQTPVTLRARLRARILFVQRGETTVKSYAVAVGQDGYPTPIGTFSINKIVWNPSWRPPPDADWAKGKTAKGPGDPANPMKVVKIFFQEPDYYIHGTDDVKSLGSAASHGCLRMDPADVADLAKLIMEEGGQPREENWFWRIIHFRREEKVVYLNNPIALTIGD